MNPTDREPSLYAKIEKLEREHKKDCAGLINQIQIRDRALAIAKHSLLKLSVRICENIYPVGDDIVASRIIIKTALEQIEKELR